MIKGKTSTGFEYEIEETAFDDMRLLGALTKLEKGDTMQLPLIVERVLGEEQEEKLYRHLEETEGRASITGASNEITEIFKNAKPGKNSLSSPE